MDTLAKSLLSQFICPRKQTSPRCRGPWGAGWPMGDTGGRRRRPSLSYRASAVQGQKYPQPEPSSVGSEGLRRRETLPDVPMSAVLHSGNVQDTQDVCTPR